MELEPKVLEGIQFKLFFLQIITLRFGNVIPVNMITLLLLLLLSRFSRVRLGATPETAARQGPLSLGSTDDGVEHGRYQEIENSKHDIYYSGHMTSKAVGKESKEQRCKKPR